MSVICWRLRTTQDGARAKIGCPVERPLRVVDHQCIVRRDAGVAEDALVKELAGLGGVDQVRAAKVHETAVDAHADQVALQLPGSFARGGAEHVPGSVQPADFLNHSWTSRPHAAGDEGFAIAAQA